MKQLKKRDLLLVGLTLFSMFFGAGNLIFPPFLGVRAGTNTWLAMTGFALSAIGLPILGVAAVAKSGGLDVLAGRVHPRFAFWFTILIYISIGPALAIPRTASTSFEMAVVPFMGERLSMGTAQMVYSVVFFGIALALAMHPDKLTDRLGKVLSPCLLLLISIMFVGCLLHPAGGYGKPLGEYASSALAAGFLDGYQTMDTIAALNFGIIIALNIQTKGVTEKGSVVRETIKAGIIAGCLLLVIYCILAHIGGITGDACQDAGNGAATLAFVARFLFGKAGMILLAMIFFIACLNTCIGLLSCCSKYFSTILPSVGYRAWVVIFALISLVISNIGLNKILEVSVPVLNAIYPVAIVLIALAFLQRILGPYPLVYPIGIAATGGISVISALAHAGVRIPGISRIVENLPLAAQGLEWVIPGAAGIAAGIIITLIRSVQKKYER